MKEYLQIVDEINQKFEKLKFLMVEEINEVKELESYQLTPQQELIMFYILRHGPVKANQIASYLNVSKSAISQVLPKLEEKKLIIRKKNKENLRESFIYLGEKGEEYQLLLQKIDEMLVKKYYSKASLEELENISNTLTKLLHTSKHED